MFSCKAPMSHRSITSLHHEQLLVCLYMHAHWKNPLLNIPIFTYVFIQFESYREMFGGLDLENLI
jgi:hypothetical protein